MKRILPLLFIALVSLFIPQNSFAIPIDLSAFTVDPGPGVNVVGNTANFIEQSDYGAIFLANDSFSVGQNALGIEFDYSFTVGTGNDDYLVAVIEYTEYVFELNQTGTGSFFIDLSAFANQTISLAFGIESNDLLTGSFGSISNLDLRTSAAPVPEPSTLLLLGSGIVGLIGFGRKKFRLLS